MTGIPPGVGLSRRSGIFCAPVYDEIDELLQAEVRRP
jgi:hypothetical protein